MDEAGRQMAERLLSSDSRGRLVSADHTDTTGRSSPFRGPVPASLDCLSGIESCIGCTTVTSHLSGPLLTFLGLLSQFLHRYAQHRQMYSLTLEGKPHGCKSRLSG
jgi:hypothetical protein